MVIVSTGVVLYQPASGFTVEGPRASNLLVSSVLTATNITLSAPTSQITLAGGASIVTGGVTPPSKPGPLIAAQEPTTRQLLTHCALPWNDACLRFEQNNSAVATASTVQVRQAIHGDAAGRWKKYQPWLGPLEALLNEAGISTDM